MQKSKLLLVFVFLSAAGLNANSQEETDLIKGVKVLVAFDPYRVKPDQQKEFQQALKNEKIKVVKQYRYGMYSLLDCGMNAQSIVDSLPYHAGAIVFADGKIANKIPSLDHRVPKSIAILRWGSSANGMKQMKKDVTRYSKMDGIKAEKIDLSNGKRVFGNPFVLRLTPTKGKTLLEVFLLADGQFDYEKTESN